jgi:hypothetical protein
MRKRFVKTTVLTLFSTALLVGCYSYLGGHLVPAASYLCALKEDGILPGIAKDEKFKMTSMPQSFSEVHSRSNSLAMVFKVEPEDRKDVLLWYYLASSNRGTTWQLIGARQSDTSAKTSIDLLHKQ